MNAPTAHAAEQVALSDLRPHPRNYRQHPEDQLVHIEQSVREHGVYRPIVAARDLTILAGHGLAEACRRVGLESVPVVRLSIDPDDPKALKLLAADNELGRFAEVDDRALTELLRQISEVDALIGTGYDEAMVAALAFVTRTKGELETLDAAAHWIGMPDYDPGELPGIRLIVSFDTPEQRDEFIEQTGFGSVSRRAGMDKTWSTWWPPRAQDDLASVTYGEIER